MTMQLHSSPYSGHDYKIGPTDHGRMTAVIGFADRVNDGKQVIVWAKLRSGLEFTGEIEAARQWAAANQYRRAEG